MIRFLTPTFIGFFSLLMVFLGDLKAMEFTEATEEILIESKNRYPNKIFNAEDFLNEVDNIDSLLQKPTVELDLSNDASLNSRDVSKILRYFKKRSIALNFLNISNTNIDESIFDEYNWLVSNPNFKYLDISGTLAAQSTDDFSKNENIIFIGKNMLERLNGEVEKAFGKEVIDRHTRYYDTTKSFTQAWEEGKFEGLNLRRVMALFPDKDNEFTDDMKERFLNSHSLINLRTLNLKKQGIDDVFIRKLSENKTFARIININLNDNEKITENSLKTISESGVIGSIRDLPQMSSRYDRPSVELRITTERCTNIPVEIIKKYDNVPQNTKFSITYLHPFDGTQTAEPVNNGIKWLHLH